MQNNLPKLDLGEASPLARYQNIQALTRKKSLRKKISNLFAGPTPKNDAMNRFKGLKGILASKPTKDLESQTSIQKGNRSQTYKMFKHYQKAIYLLVEQPKSSILGRCLLGSIFAAIFFNVGEAIIANPDTIFRPPIALAFFEFLTLCIFILEFVLRLVSSTAFDENIIRALMKPIVLIDIIAIFPFFVEVSPVDGDFQTVTKDIRLLSLMKSVCIFKLLRYVKTANVFAEGVSKSLASLLFFFFVITITAFIFAILIYYAEQSNPDSKLRNGIPTALWWAVVTLSTTGYGDVVPTTPGGKVIGGLAGVSGMLLLALPVVILGYHFEEVYNDREEGKLIEKVKKKELKDSTNLDHDQKEVFFLKRRIVSIEASNKKVMSQLEDSGSIYKGVSKDLKMLYTSIYAGVQTKKEGVEETLKEKIKGMEKFQAAKTKIKLIHIFKNAPKSTDRSAELQHGRRDSTGIRLNAKKLDSDPVYDLEDHDGLRNNIVESMKKMATLVSNESPLLLEKLKRFEGINSHLGNFYMPKIIVDKPDVTDSIPEDDTGNDCDTRGMLDIPSTDPNALENMKLNLSLVNSRYEDDGEVYRDLVSLQSLRQRPSIGASKQLLAGEDPAFRRSSAYYPSANTVSLVGNLTRTISRGSYFQPRSAFLGPRSNKDYYAQSKQHVSIEQSSLEEGDSRGSSRIIEIPFKGG